MAANQSIPHPTHHSEGSTVGELGARKFYAVFVAHVHYQTATMAETIHTLTADTERELVDLYGTWKVAGLNERQESR